MLLLYISITIHLLLTSYLAYVFLCAIVFNYKIDIYVTIWLS